MKRLLAAFLLCSVVLLAGCARGYHVIEEKWVLKEQNVITFSDGAQADLWRTEFGSRSVYKLTDGTELLTVNDPSGPANVYVGGLESYDDLSETAQKAVSAFYDKQGLFYNVETELKNAYADYLACKENGTEYYDRLISQDISPTASNAHIMCFLTAVTLPVNGLTGQERRLGAVFDRQTGEALSGWDLFNVPEEEARQWLLDAFKVDDPVLKAEMKAALKPEYIILFPENLEVTFPQGTLPSQELSYGFGFDMDEVQSVLQPWAIPDQPK